MRRKRVAAQWDGAVFATTCLGLKWSKPNEVKYQVNSVLVVACNLMKRSLVTVCKRPLHLWLGVCSLTNLRQ
ncbi:hypothetical protein [Anaeromusa sp.]|uniref:hypothetical protein n=1 Tax=Anaeromusa sp. TaxID=1872520 RepID=UPI0029C9505C|nr:hypothetical protein [Anaeromusa sp.]MEA4836583.1 hypothetical protein [Anaeromusa sp.]NCB78151.1 hypothetical protein [Negativicutes bacterium]